jgi:hypothetical protein
VTALTKLPPIQRRSRGGDAGAGYWSGAGRYERGDRRDHRLLHWSYGLRQDQARIRRVLGLLERSWRGRRGKSYRTAGRILAEIALAWNRDQRISRVCKSSIAHRLGLHRNTVYRQCRTLIRLGLLIQGQYAAPKGGQYKSYAVFAIADMSGRLPIIISFRRRHGRHARFVDIAWPTSALAAYGRRSTALIPDTPRTGDAPSKKPKMVHNTCDSDLYMSQTSERRGYGTAPLRSRQVVFSAARGGGLRKLFGPAPQQSSRGQDAGLEGKASQIRPARSDASLSGIERIRSRMKAFEQAFGHLASYSPPEGWPRGWMRGRVAALSDSDWSALVELVLSRPLLTGEALMPDGKRFELNFWWLMRHAPRLLRQTQPPGPELARHPRPTPIRGRPAGSPKERRAVLKALRATSPQLADALESLGGTFLDGDGDDA